MVNLVVALVAKWRVAIYELAGGGLVVSGAAVIGGQGPALIVGGVALLAKSLEHDLKRTAEGRQK